MPRTLVPQDLYQFVTVGDPQITPEGDLIAFVRGHIDPDSKEPGSAIWVVPAAGGAPVQFTRGPRSDTSPRWSPDGRTLAFVSDRGGDRQIWLIDRFGGEARQLTTMRHEAGDPVWSPDGSRIAFTSLVGPDDPRELLTRPMSPGDKEADAKKARDEARTFTIMNWRFDPVGIRPPRRSQIWAIAVPGPGAPPPEPVQITWGYYDHSGVQWSPDGRQIAFSAKRSDDEHARFADVHIASVPAADASRAETSPRVASAGDAARAEQCFECTCITGSRGMFWGGCFSPDGQTLAVLGHEMAYENATQARIWLFPVEGGEPRVLDHWDLDIAASVNADVRPGGTGVIPTWAPDGNVLYLPVTERGACAVYGWPVAGGKPQLIAGGDREISAISFDRNCELLAFVAGDLASISDLYVMDCREFEERRLTQVNEQLFRELTLPRVNELEFAARDGLGLHGWIMKPVGFQAGVRYPLVLQIHGGPHTCWGHAFHLEMNLMAARGYGVLFINPRGSTGYGQEFVNAVRGDYGGQDYTDLMDAVDHALGLGWVDDKRLAVTGGSYGGFMTNWAVTQTERFAAAIAHRSISNWVSFAGTPDFGPFFNIMQHKVADPWSPEGVEELWRISPLKHVRRVKTPIALMHSESDYRCPIEQAEQFYMAVKYYGQAPAELVRHPRSNHDLTRMGPPVLRVDRLERIFRWLDLYCPAGEAGTG